MTACPMETSRRYVQLLHGNIVGRVELTALQSGRALALLQA
jgi:hypothetical protein